MINDLAWRKLPRDIIRNEYIDYISQIISKDNPAMQAAPLMFYFVAYCKADDDGVFSVDDGIIFSRLMRIGTPDDVLQIAGLMAKYKLITSINTGVYMLNDWEAPDRKGQRPAQTAEERRASVQKRFPCEPVEVNFNRDRNFFAPVNDKNGKNVATQPAVATNSAKMSREQRGDRGERELREGDREDQRAETEQTEQTETDRQTEFKKEIEKEDTQSANPPAFLPAFGFASEELETQEPEETEDGTDREITSLAESALTSTQENSSGESQELMKNGESTSTESKEVFNCLANFFAKKCLGFKVSEHTDAMNKLTARIVRLHDQKNSGKTVAQCICSQLVRLVESKDGYYSTLPIIPESLAKADIYQRCLSLASKILLTKGCNEEAWKQELISAEERQKTQDWIKAECIKYGIDPNAPNAFELLTRRKATA